jgi:MFS family permease
MTIQRSRPFGQKYAFVVVAVVFLALLASAGMRATPGVLMLPLGRAFGWSRDDISSAAAVGILLYGLMGPFAAALMQRFGIKRVLLTALAVMALAAASSALMSRPWHLLLTWGVLSGAGTGCVAVVLGATVVGRWFSTHRGLMMGLLTASTATGTLIFLPGLAAIAQYFGWRPVVLTIAAVCALLLPLVLWLMPERPSDIGLTRYGASSHEPVEAGAQAGNPFMLTLGTLQRASKRGVFWLLFATFFVCGFTTNGLIGTHFIALCGDHGIPEVRAAGVLAMMGVCDLIGTTASGWLTDRFDPRKIAVRVLRAARPVADVPALLRFLALQPVAVRRVLRFGLDRDGAAHLAPDHRSLWRARRAGGVRLGRRRASGRRGDGCLHGRRVARAVGQLPHAVRDCWRDGCGGGVPGLAHSAPRQPDAVGGGGRECLAFELA